MTDEIHVGDIGTVFTVTVEETDTAVNISSATTKQILFRKPDGTLLTKTASFATDGTDGKLTYTTIADDLSEAGAWKVQAYVAMPSWSGHSSQDSFVVHSNLP